MRKETILNAMVKAKDNAKWMESDYKKYERQYRAFRDRLLNMFDEQEDLIDSQRKVIRMRDRQIRELESTLEKCLELATVVDRERRDHMLSDMKLGWKLAKEILDEVKNG